jgi:hypothetical protein
MDFPSSKFYAPSVYRLFAEGANGSANPTITPLIDAKNSSMRVLKPARFLFLL